MAVMRLGSSSRTRRPFGAKGNCCSNCDENVDYANCDGIAHCSVIVYFRYEGGALMARLVAGVTENFASEEMAVEVEEYFKKSGFSGTERTVQQSLESIRLQKEWLARDAQHVKDFIAKQIAV